MLDEALTAPDRWTYTDLAITPPKQDEFEALSLYHETSGGEAALARKRREDAIREHSHATRRRRSSMASRPSAMPASRRRRTDVHRSE